MTSMEKTPNKPFSPSSERNKQPIWKVLQPYLANSKSVLEIGSGTGQHAVFFCSKNAQMHWQMTNLPEYIEGCEIWREDSQLENLSKCLSLDVKDKIWPLKGRFDFLYTANTFHIMSLADVELFWQKIPNYLHIGAMIFVYGPFKYAGEFTSDSNQKFDQRLNSENSDQGIKNFEDILQLAKGQNFELVADHSMPANNQLLVFKHSCAS